MTAFLFKPTNEFIGKFEVLNLEAIPGALQKFLAKRQRPPLFSYLEVPEKAWTIVCYEPFRLIEGIVSQRAWSARLEGNEKDHDQQYQTVAFECVDCGTGLRLRLHAVGNAIYRCPSCKTEYKTIHGKGEPSVLLVVPSSLRQGQSSDTRTKRKKQMPLEVRSALAVFALAEEATFEDAHRAYRENVKQYHPDRVAHLGPELRRVAELKTKEFNTAFQILEKFYSA